MGRWLELVRTSRRPPLWLDDTAYSSRLLAGGAPPWRDAAAFTSWRRKALQLLKPDVAVIDVAALACGWPERSGLLRDSAFLYQLGELARALRGSTDKPLALSLPAPALWLAVVEQFPPGEGDGPDMDAIDDAAGDMADLLRSQSESGVDVVLLRDGQASAEHRAELIELYASLTNTARHYRWDIGLRTPDAPPADLGSFDFAIAPAGALGVDLGEQFWSGVAPAVVAAGGFHFATVPTDAQPSQVLARLESRA